MNKYRVVTFDYVLVDGSYQNVPLERFVSADDVDVLGSSGAVAFTRKDPTDKYENITFLVLASFDEIHLVEE